jgi:cytosine/adenosine deaminase-related metal-dependent hydrolase
LPPTKNELCLIFDNALAFPGLINSHEHLDFNLFPLLGNRIYHNYMEWGADIHERNKDIIQAVLKIPQQLRAEWGIYKNLFNGVTTVVNHGQRLAVQSDLIDIYQGCQSLHSLEGEKNWKYKLNLHRGSNMAAIHIGEGTDKAAADEVDRLIKWNIFRRKIAAIHGVAMNARQASSFAALIWCPDSNYFLLGATAPVHQLKDNTTILFGTDSTLTSDWNLWEHLRLAREQNMVSDQELFDMLTLSPAAIWGFPHLGGIAEDLQADIVIAKPPADASGWDAFYTLNPENILLVLHKGKIVMFDDELYDQLVHTDVPLPDFWKIYLDSSCKYVRGNLPSLVENIQKYYPSAPFPMTIP